MSEIPHPDGRREGHFNAHGEPGDIEGAIQSEMLYHVAVQLERIADVLEGTDEAVEDGLGTFGKRFADAMVLDVEAPDDPGAAADALDRVVTGVEPAMFDSEVEQVGTVIDYLNRLEAADE